MVMVESNIERTENKARRAFALAEKQVRRLISDYPDYFPIYTENGKWKHAGELQIKRICKRAD